MCITLLNNSPVFKEYLINSEFKKKFNYTQKHRQSYEYDVPNGKPNLD